MHVQEMIATHPQAGDKNSDALIQCIEECYACSQACVSCADACLGEEMVAKLRQCIRLNLDCADVCASTGAIATRRVGFNDNFMRQMLEVCAEACRLCAEECGKHAEMHGHCRVCAEACRVWPAPLN